MTSQCPTTKVCGLLSSRALCSSSGEQPRTLAIAYIVLGASVTSQIHSSWEGLFTPGVLSEWSTRDTCSIPSSKQFLSYAFDRDFKTAKVLPLSLTLNFNVLGPDKNENLMS